MLGEIPFPVVFRICIKPAYNETFLKEAGYRQTWDYFTGSHHFKPSSPHHHQHHPHPHHPNQHHPHQAAASSPPAQLDGPDTQRRAVSSLMSPVSAADDNEDVILIFVCLNDRISGIDNVIFSNPILSQTCWPGQYQGLTAC